MLTNEHNGPSSRGSIGLKFTGVDDDTTSEDVDETKEADNRTRTPDSTLSTSNGHAHHHLTVNHCYGKHPVRFPLFHACPHSDS